MVLFYLSKMFIYVIYPSNILNYQKKTIFVPTGRIGRLHQKPADFL